MIKIIPKHDTHDKWNMSSFIPRENELIHIIDKNRIAIGDGVTPYPNLKKYRIPKGLKQLALVYRDRAMVVLDLTTEKEK